eukprot:gnl/TRDRNA2_/TRDRNA2_191642_c0_seq1.p1 gnl/TRDRNA2_/TRDRNA2_191642_c0~~gnl/TRDRNA2_/TRDRNA2_191642_c0_seq1.p1  ORF type:complete len:431 (-),score=118.49 gnl/TRDRNA2_/TRDRNA2_191642_c0_seq1:80-1372(-)
MSLERHRDESLRHRAELEELLRRAQALQSCKFLRRGQKPGTVAAAKADRESELDAVLERTVQYRQEIKRLRRELESRERAAAGEHRDPMELPNQISQRRRELSALQRAGAGLDKVAEAQKRAERAQNAVNPEIAEKKKFLKEGVEKERQLYIKLMAEKQRADKARKSSESEVRKAERELNGKAKQLERPSHVSPKGRGLIEEPPKLKLLRRDADILAEAVRQDERRLQLRKNEDDQLVGHARSQISKLNESIANREANLGRLREELRQSECALAAAVEEAAARVSPSAAAGIPRLHLDLDEERALAEADLADANAGRFSSGDEQEDGSDDEGRGRVPMQESVSPTSQGEMQKAIAGLEAAAAAAPAQRETGMVLKEALVQPKPKATPRRGNPKAPAARRAKAEARLRREGSDSAREATVSTEDEQTDKEQ